MKTGKFRKNLNKGIVTMELLIAMAIGVIMLAGAVLVSFGGQAAALDTNLTTHGLYRASTRVASTSAMLATALGWDWVSDASADDDIYKLNDSVSFVSPCVKYVGENTDWQSEKNRGQYINFGTLVGSISELKKLGGDCDLTPPSGWDNPASLVEENITGQSAATDIDAIGDQVYLTTNPSSKKANFFIYDFDSVAKSLTLVNGSGLDVDPDAPGEFLSLDVAGKYAFAASASTTSQFVAIDVSVPSNPVVVARRQLKNVSPTGSFPQAVAIKYYGGRVYISTRETDGPEFHVFDVSDPNPANWSEIGNGLELNTSVYDIAVQGGYAYLATSDNSSELCIIDISDLDDPTKYKDCESYTGVNDHKYNTPTDQDGGGIYVLGHAVYLGLSRSNFDNNSSASDFYVLNASDISNITEYDSADLGISKNTTNVGIVVRNGLAFIALDNPTSGLQIYDVSNPSDIKLNSACGIYNFSENTTGIDMANNFVFTSNGSNAEIRVIYDKQIACPL